ncbi:SDR family NAD(P)-dependent oxidoreductase [Mycolicibacterium palauense]|uniref:SDR family NAD(P)-dependent oxidoreductase n=1 Tax=Mycolicibacterium palauense TaxID=2034511 RepID=UPI000BFEB8A3|nr:SDR family oxidoreductase [Mycolicibacterium palauense]
MGSLEGKVAVITGGSNGIGLATAHRFVAEGARVFITGRNQRRLDDAVAGLGGNAHAVCGDASDLDHLDALYATISEVAGGLDIVVAAPGMRLWRLFADVTATDFDAAYDINVRGVFFTVQKALPLLRDGSSIVLVGSSLSHRGQPGLSLYGSTKATLQSFARTWAAELGARQIRVNVLSAGPVDTRPTEVSPDMVDADVARRQALREASPLKRIGRPEELASAILFLAGDESTYMTGAELLIDGGLTVK